MKFTVLRVLLGLMCAMAETYFYRYLLILVFNPFLHVFLFTCICSSRAVQRKYGRSVSRWLLFFLVPSCGMFISSTAFLPSSFTMYTAMVATAAWFDGSIFVSYSTKSLTHSFTSLLISQQLAIFMTALGALVGWPFAALIGSVTAHSMLFICHLSHLLVFL